MLAIVTDSTCGLTRQEAVELGVDVVPMGYETDFERICSSTSMTVRVEFANGRVYTLSNALVRGNPTVSETGECSIDFAGEKGVWS